jgi:hypothetical protein
MLRLVLFLVSLGAWTIKALFLCRSELLAENLALRQQVGALKRERPRPPLDDVDCAFRIALRAFWPGWASRRSSLTRIRSRSGPVSDLGTTGRRYRSKTAAQGGLESIRRFDALSA